MNENAMVPITEVEKMAAAVVKSRLFPSIQSPEQAMTLMLICQAEGLHPIEALKQYDVIQGRAAMKAEAMLARFQSRGGKVEWMQNDDTEARAKFYSPGVVGFFEYAYTIEDAKKAGLENKDNYKKNRRAMLRARCVSGGVRATDPGAILACYTPEEVQDFDDHKTAPPAVHVKTDVEILANPSLDVEEKPLAQVLDEAKVKSLGAVETYAPEAVERTDRIALTEAQQRIVAREEAVAAVDKSLPLKEQLVQIEEHVRAKVAKEKRDACKLCGSPLGDYTSHAGVEYRQCIKAHGDWEAARKMGIEGMGLKDISKGHTYEKQKVADLSDQLNQALAE